MSKKECCATHKTSVGGQALIEGIMMQGPKGAAMAVRTPDGGIDLEYKTVKHIRDKIKPLGWPVIRGFVNFIETMIFGYKCLMESAEKSGFDDIEMEEDKMSKLDKWIDAHWGKTAMTVVSTIASILGVLLAFALFFYLPTISVNFITNHVSFDLSNWRATLEGVMRIIIFIIYLALVSQMKDIRRTFMYHGAEHKTIFCYEAGLELTVENVRKQSRFHPRCGTSFMFVMIILSVVLSSVISVLFPQLRDVTVIWMLVKVLMLPFIMGLGYEFIRYAGRHDNFLIKALSAPGLWMQRLTTKEPDYSMIEIGIAAFKAVITDNPEDDAI